ncbi:uncharacterized protein K02A2.6-like [Paramuricea clavata]|uniref:Uncharacterized protein K02A2.6-like n=1 Tax=Paramuricea clavata TaxID=317549 RepID=A0A6S7IJ84_PARCT|nr:uncharacterized protein K02A2.6-like [Paramuricea clavata]
MFLMKLKKAGRRISTYFFAANDVDDNHQVPTLLSLIGSKTYSLLKDLLLPEKPADKNFDEIVSTLQKHLNPKPLEITERFRFYKINQQEGEGILGYVAELKKLTTHCNFGSNLGETLRDRLVCGLSNQQILKPLLAESKLKFSKAADIAVAMETATRDATEIHSEGREEKPLGLDKLTLNRPSNRSDSGPPSPVVCYRCGANTHVATECRFKKEVCHKCGKRETEPDKYGHLLNNLEVHNVNKSNNDVIWVDVKVENQPLSMEIDTGSAVSILPCDMFLEKFRDKKLEKTTTVLKTYTGELIVPVGCLTMQVEYLDQLCLLPFHVVQTKGPVLMGRDWLHKLRLNWKTIKLLKASDPSHRNPGTTTQGILKNLLDTYAEVFEDKLGTFKSAKARITLKEGSQPQFRKARQVPYSLRPKVEEKLKRLQSEGILSKVEWSDWATPIVPVPKQDGSVRICGDFKAGGKKFSKIDRRQAYHQIELQEESKKYLTLNTSMGLFQYNRLVFGITSAPAISQRTMDQLLEGTSGISCILDDMIVTGKSDGEHMANLEEVFRRLHHHGLRANKSKCEFFKEKITFCGHDINSEGLHKTTDKTAAMVNAPRPQSVAVLQRNWSDAHSKWPEVEIMPSTTSTQTIDRLRTIFPRYGVPAQVVTDNGPQFTSAEFQLFLKTNGIKLITTAPFHPATNGQAKRFVQSFKHAMKCEKQSASQLKTNMAKFLLAYRNSPHSTGESPSVLFLGRPLWTRLDLVKPDLQRNSKVMNRQIDQAGRKGHSPTRQLSIGQTVMAL